MSQRKKIEKAARDFFDYAEKMQEKYNIDTTDVFSSMLSSTASFMAISVLDYVMQGDFKTIDDLIEISKTNFEQSVRSGIRSLIDMHYK